MPRRQQHLSTNVTGRVTSSLFTVSLFLSIMLQQLHPHLCYHEVRNYQKRLFPVLHKEVTSLPRTSAESAAVDKRTLTSGTGIGGSVSQPEEIFSASNQLESNYDEYPMVVPKRAALLLDRLMVALHHALEKEHSGSTRLSDFYGKNNNGKTLAPSDQSKDEASDSRDPQDKDSPYLAMYSDDDPSVMMDYDFKDLNSINRATGETLMAQSFQRRANLGLDLGDDVGMEGVSLLSASSSAHGGGLIGGVNSADTPGGGRTNFGPNGRMYWRCYFNAVSCF